MLPLQLGAVILDIHSISDNFQANFRKEALAVLAKVIRFDSAVWASGTHNPHRLNNCHLHNQPQSLIALYEREFLFKQDFVRMAAVATPGKAVLLSDLKTREAFQKMLTYKILCRPLGIEQSMALTRINQLTGLSEFIALWRKNPDDLYDETDRQHMELLCPHLFHGEQRWLHRNLALEDQTDRAKVHALFDAFGVLRVAETPIAEHLVASWPDWKGPILPTAILQTAKLSKELGTTQIITTPEGRRYEIKPYSYPLVGATYKISVVHDAMMIMLSPREKEVARLYARGLSHKEIARSLGSAPNTVRNQCVAALRKLGLRNKTELANRLGPPKQRDEP